MFFALGNVHLQMADCWLQVQMIKLFLSSLKCQKFAIHIKSHITFTKSRNLEHPRDTGSYHGKSTSDYRQSVVFGLIPRQGA